MIDLYRILKTLFYTGPVKEIPKGSRHCPDCDGTGNYDSFMDCLACDGKGYINYEVYIKAIQKIDSLRE